MNIEANVESATETQANAPAPKADDKPEMKSRDTGFINTLKEKAATAPPPKPPKADVKPDSNATSAGKEDDADSSADHPDEKTIPPWMKKRLVRAEEKGRRAGRTETLEEVRSVRTAPAEPAKTDQPKAPAVAAQPKSLADFDYDIERYNAHMIREGVQQALKDRDAENDRQRQAKTAEEARTAFEKRKSEFEKRAGEGAWDEMVSAKVDVPQEVIDLLTGHEKDLDIAHYLVHHPGELDKLRGKSKLEMARGLATIETRLTGSTQEELPPKVTKTPAPPPSINGSGKSSKSIDDMSTAERIAHWRSQKAARR
jgi:hypothetical protein